MGVMVECRRLAGTRPPARGCRDGESETAMMNATERALNMEAKFLPMDEEDTLPCLEVGGVQVYAYFEGGRLRVSVHYDTAEEVVVSSQGTIPTRIDAGPTTVREGE